MPESMSSFDALRELLNIAKEYGIELTPELFNNTVNAVHKENPMAIMGPMLEMLKETKDAHVCRAESEPSAGDGCYCKAE